MARSCLASDEIVEILRPFIVTNVHAGGDNLSDLEPEATRILTESELFRDPNRSNVFLFVLDQHGAVVHECHGLPGRTEREGSGRSDWTVEISRALAKLKLPDSALALKNGRTCRLPDIRRTVESKGLRATGAANGPLVPAGVRIFVRQDDPSNSHYSQLPVVEVVPMMAEEWSVLSFTPRSRQIEADALKSWLIWLYPAGIRTADELKRFKQFRGTLRLEPAGSDDEYRYALLRGEVRLAKDDDTQSAFEGTFQGVLSYQLDTAEVHALRAVVEGVYIYRLRDTTRQVLSAAIESRPE